MNGAGQVIATETTGPDGSYTFANVAPGTYAVKFTDTVSGKTLTTQNANNNQNDDIDSDAADLGGGVSQIDNVVVAPGQESENNDAGVVPGNVAPDALDDMVKLCADETATLDVLANDTDPMPRSATRLL